MMHDVNPSQIRGQGASHRFSEEKREALLDARRDTVVSLTIVFGFTYNTIIVAKAFTGDTRKIFVSRPSTSLTRRAS